MGNRHAGRRDPRDVVVGEIDAVRGDQFVGQEADALQQLRRRAAAALGDDRVLQRALRQMGPDIQPGLAREAGNLAEQFIRAGVRRMRREHHMRAPVAVRCGAASSVRSVASMQASPIAGIMAPDAFMHPREIDVVEARAGPHAQIQVGHGRERHVRVDIAVDHRGRSERQRLQRAEARQRDGLVLGDVVAVRDAARIGGRKAHIERDAAHQRKHRMGMHIDEAGRHEPSVGLDDARRRKSAGSRRARADERDAISGEAENALPITGRAGSPVRSVAPTIAVSNCIRVV